MLNFQVHFAPHMWEKVRIDGKKKLKACAVPTIFLTSPIYLLLSERNDISVKRKNILDSVAILRRKSKYSTKKGRQMSNCQFFKEKYLFTILAV